MNGPSIQTMPTIARTADQNMTTQTEPPIAQVAEQTTPTPPPTVDSSELYTVEANETVAGNLDKYTDFETPLMKRIAQQGIDQAASRGLTNSSIASGNAMGKVLDKAGEWATTDAAAYANRKTESLRSATSQYGTDRSVEASKYGADKDLEGTKYSSDAQKAASKYSADQGLAGTKISASAQVQSAQLSASATVAAAQASASARIEAEKMNSTSNEKIEASRAATAEKQIKSQEVLRNMDAADRIKAAEVLATTNRATAQKNAKNAALTSAGNGYTAAVANINIESSAASQREQLDRINDAYDIEIDAIEALAL